MLNEEQMKAEWLSRNEKKIGPVKYAAAVTGAVPLRPASEVVIKKDEQHEWRRKASARGAHATNEQRRRMAQDRAARLKAQWLADPRPETINEMVLQEGCSRGRVVEILREQGCSVRKKGRVDG